MAETIGKRLRAARESKGLSIEDAAFETRIHATYIRGLENDDYSQFASTTYAKSFLTLYSRHLGVDAGSALEYFVGSDDLRLSGSGFLPTLQPTLSSSTREMSRRESRPRKKVNGESPGFAPLLLGAFVVVLLVGIPVLWFLGKDAESIDDVTTKAKSIAEATREEISSKGGLAQSESPAPATSPATSVIEPAPAPAPSPVIERPAAPKSAKVPKSPTADWVLGSSEETESAPAIPAPVGTRSEPIRAIPATEEELKALAGETESAPVPSAPVEPDSSSAATADSPRMAHTDPQSRSTSLVDGPVLDSPMPAAPPKKPSAKATEPGKPEPKKPEVKTPETGKPVIAVPIPESETPQVLRATPLVAQPVAIPVSEDEPTVAKPVTEDEPPFVDSRNRFPRPANGEE